MRLRDLQEAHVDDMQTKQFNLFRSKYNKVRGKKNLYVQFTNHKDNTVDKSAFNNPTNHSDFVGVYGYPLDYVLKHPMDVWYAHDAKYLRVLEINNTGSVLDFTGMDEYRATQILQKLPPRFFHGTAYSRDSVIRDIVKEQQFKGKNRWGRALLYFIQHDFDEDGTLDTNTRSGLEQTKMVKQLGFDIVIDRAKSHKTATINDREPEQVVFLNRNAFKVVDIFTLRFQQDAGNSITASGNVIDDDYVRKLSALISNAIGSKLKDIHKQYMNYYAWTKRGDMLTINVSNTPSSLHANEKGLDIQMGQKPHRYNTTYDNNTATIAINSDHGVIKDMVDEDDTIKQVALRIKQEYDGLPEDGNFIPSNKDSYLKAQKDKERQKKKEQFDQKKNKEYSMYEQFIEPLLNKYDLTELKEKGKDREIGIKIYKTLKMFFENNKEGYNNFSEYLDMIEKLNKDDDQNVFDIIYLNNLPKDIIPHVKLLADNLQKDGAKFNTNLILFIQNQLT